MYMHNAMVNNTLKYLSLNLYEENPLHNNTQRSPRDLMYKYRRTILIMDGEDMESSV